MYYKIENGFLLPIEKKDIEKNDYILNYWEITIVDKDKRTIRPYVEDMLRQMNIETLQIKLLKMLSILVTMLLFITFVLSVLIWSNTWKIKVTNNIINELKTTITDFKMKNTNLNTNL